MIPVRDENRSLSTPHVTWIIIIINVAAFVATWLPSFLQVSAKSLSNAFYDFGMIPESIIQGQNLHTLFTSMFLHGGLIHLAGNMLFLYIFGDNIEDAFGHLRYLGFYILCGLVASLTYLLTMADPGVPVIGASGAISGVLGAYFILYPRARIITLVFFIFIIFVRVPAVIFLGYWFILQLFSGIETVAYGVPTEVAHWAHIGGFVAGIAVALLFRAVRKPPKPESTFYGEIEI